MNPKAVIAQWRAFLPTIGYVTPSGNPLPVFGFAPPMPVPDSVDRPFVCVKPRNQLTLVAASREVITTGPYRVIFFDQIGGDETSVEGVIDHASDFAHALERAINNNLTPAGVTVPNGHQLGNPALISWAGDGSGIAANFDEVVQLFDVSNNPIWGVYFDVDVQEVADAGV